MSAAATEPQPPPRGLFITLEGIDGAGKSSAIPVITHLLTARNIPFVVTREPGGTPVGEKVRDIVLNDEMHAETEALLVFAARREHIAKVIEPALAAGTWVVSDRFTDASFAYQGGGHGVVWSKLTQLESWVHADLQPNLTLLFDVAPEVAQDRLAHSRNALDKFEREKAAFFVSVRAAYLRRRDEAAARIHIVQAGGTHSEVNKIVENVILSHCFKWLY